jgi:hypothetical protein
MTEWLDTLPIWKNLPYPIKSALIRAVRAGLAGIVGILVAALAAGTLIPVGTSPIVVVVVTLVLQGLDKYLREKNIATEAEETNTDEIPEPEPTDEVISGTDNETTDVIVPDTDTIAEG